MTDEVAALPHELSQLARRAVEEFKALRQLLHHRQLEAGASGREINDLAINRRRLRRQAIPCRFGARALLALCAVIAVSSDPDIELFSRLSSKYMGARLKTRLNKPVKVESWTSRVPHPAESGKTALEERPPTMGLHRHERQQIHQRASPGRRHRSGCDRCGRGATGGQSRSARDRASRSRGTRGAGGLPYALAWGLPLRLTLHVLARLVWRPLLRLLGGRRSSRLPRRLLLHLPAGSLRQSLLRLLLDRAALGFL